MIQIILEKEREDSFPIDVPPVSSGERQPFMRDRTRGETEDYIRFNVKSGVWVSGVYRMFHDGNFLGSVEVPA